MTDNFPNRLITDWIACTIPDVGERKVNGIIIMDDDMKERGIRPRMARIEAVSPDSAEKGFAAGQYVLIEHLGWTRPIKLTYSDGVEKNVYYTVPEKIQCWVNDVDPEKLPIIEG